MVASNRRKIDFDTYVRWTAHLIDAGHNYVCVSGKALIHAAEIDAQAGECPGYFFRQTTNTIGGAAAEPASHIRVVLEFLRRVWSGPSRVGYREKTTGLLLEKLIRERTADYRKILRTVAWVAADNMAMTLYISDWMRGHFIDLEASRLSPAMLPDRCGLIRRRPGYPSLDVPLTNSTATFLDRPCRCAWWTSVNPLAGRDHRGRLTGASAWRTWLSGGASWMAPHCVYRQGYPS
jgi:hypothetical protein